MLADFDEDGSLSLPEFLIAMHLIQAKRNGSQLPETTPDGLLPRQLKETDITPISDADAKAYGAAFKKLDLDATGYLAGVCLGSQKLHWFSGSSVQVNLPVKCTHML